MVHDRNELSVDIIRLRELFAQNDAAVSALYGWQDIALDHQIGSVSYLPATDNSRFAMNETARLEIIKRLAMLNRERSESQEEEPESTEMEQDEPLEEGLFASREVRRGTGGG
jgi:hypothetical protein